MPAAATATVPTPTAVAARPAARPRGRLGLLALLALLGHASCTGTIDHGALDAAGPPGDAGGDAGASAGDSGGDATPPGDGATGGDGPAASDGAVPDAAPPGPEVTATFTPTTAVFPNPERGFYGWAGSDFVTGLEVSSVQAAFAAGHRLVLALGKLDAYRTTDLPGAFLTSLGQSFAAVRAAGMKTTLLFSYDFTAGGNDATATQIARHLEQLAPVLAAHADVIPYMRAGFIGAWGEWHSSQNGNSCGYNSGTTPCDVAAANRLIVRDALLAHVPPSVQIGFRYPPDLMAWYPDPREQHRAGMHNDCFLAGPSDSGTYANQAQRDYAMALTEAAAFGGETCGNAETPLRDTCADILTEGADYHLAWLNINYYQGFITAWQNGGCFDEVTAFMGYRLQLDGVTHLESAPPDSVVTVKVDVRNVGWARTFGQDRPLVVVLRPAGGGAAITGASSTTLQSLPAQATASTRVDVPVLIPAGAAPGAYAVLAAAPDPSPALADDARFAVRFANADDAAAGQAWDATAGAFALGTTLTVE
jgi:hypothetical protein